MGLFDKFRKKSAQNPAKAQDSEDLPVYSGMRVEVAAAVSDRLLFVGTLMHPRGNTAELVQDSESSVDTGVTSVEVRIRGYNDRVKKAVNMDGVIYPVPQRENTWEAQKLKVTRVSNDRAYYRIDTDLDAAVAPYGSLGMVGQPCKMLNISVGGVRLASEAQWKKGDKFMLRVKLAEGRDESHLGCEVLRIIPQEGGGFHYGCQFFQMSDADREQITQNIFLTQRRMRDSQ